MAIDGFDPVGSLAWALVRASLDDWEPRDVRRYFEMAYQDADMSLYVRTDSGRAARVLAEGVAEMLVERMKVLKARDERYLLP